MVNRKICRSMSLLVILLALLWPAAIMAADYAGVTAVIDQKYKFNIGMLVVADEEGSSEEINVVTDKGVFIIVDTTKIIDQRGNEISIEKLAVPCEARLTYQPLEGRNPNADKIQILRTLPGASSAWPAPIPY